MTIGLVIYGMVYVSQDLEQVSLNQRNSIGNISQSQRAVETLSVAGGNSPLETKDPNNNEFDGHISAQQTRSINIFQKLLGVEPYGGVKTITSLLQNVADSSTPYSKEDIPFYWEVAGFGQLASDICKCFPIKIAASFGDNKAGNHEALETINVEGKACQGYNANLGNHDGTLRAKNLGMFKEVIPDFVSSPFLPEIASLFTSEHKGRIYASIPNTNARITWSYSYLKSKGLIEGSILEYVSSDHVLVNNYLTHMLSGKWGGVQELTEEDLALAIKTLREKFVVTSWAYNRKIVQQIMKNEGWDQNRYECMYPPESPYSKQAQSQPRPAPPPKSAEEIATEAAIALHNRWDNRLMDAINKQAEDQLAAME